MAARLAAWRDVLVQRGVAVEVQVDPTSFDPMRTTHPPERALRWAPAASGALPLTVGFRAIGGVPDGVVELGLGDPVNWVLSLPDCGCDACDSGSADLLEALDDFLELVVTGTFLRVDVAHGFSQTTWEGAEGQWSGGGPVDVRTLLDEARAGRSPHRVTTGAAWL